MRKNKSGFMTNVSKRTVPTDRIDLGYYRFCNPSTKRFRYSDCRCNDCRYNDLDPVKTRYD